MLVLSEFRSFNFDLSHFWYPFWYKGIKHHIIYGKSDFGGLSCYWSLNICQEVLKSANLLQKWGFVDFQLSSAVSLWNSKLQQKSQKQWTVEGFCCFSDVIGEEGHCCPCSWIACPDLKKCTSDRLELENCKPENWKIVDIYLETSFCYKWKHA